MRKLVSIIGLWLAGLSLPAAVPSDYQSLKNEAETLVAEGSYAKAHEVYSRAGELSNLSSNEVRWVAFRLADTQWRSEAGTQTADTTKLDAARQGLEVLVRDAVRPDEHDLDLG